MNGSATSFLVVSLGNERVGVSLAEVREIVALSTPTRVPAVPSWILGVVNLRGAVLPLVDLGVKFGFGATPLGARSCVVVVELTLEQESTAMGVVAASVEDVLDVKPEDVESAPPFGASIRVDFLHGLLKEGETWMPLLDLAKILRYDELILVAKAAGESDEDALDAH
jgi:purine-binding chemotaxis protein CheW